MICIMSAAAQDEYDSPSVLSGIKQKLVLTCYPLIGVKQFFVLH